MEENEEEKKSEIIIVRRGGGDHEDKHHGGAWKIAYADFMTAMMAFFLVMWLVNVASEDAKQAMANYFNPIKLTDRTPQEPDMKDDSAAVKEHVKKETQEEEANNRDVSAKNRNPTFDDDAKMLDEPYGALETIAMLERQDGYKRDDTGSDQGGQQPPAPVTALRDPFSPDYWQAAPELEDTQDTQPEDTLEADIKQQLVEKLEEQPETPIIEEETVDPEVVEVANIVANDADALMKEVMQGRDAQERPQMDVRVQEDGIVIELTDTQNFGMFAVGSAKPETHVVELLEGLAKIIDKYPGEVVISGYTDARPYKSTAPRAQMAHYMLVRGGLDETRILKVEGYADRHLRNEQDSYAAENRRIAIFLKTSSEQDPQPGKATEKLQEKNSAS